MAAKPTMLTAEGLKNLEEELEYLHNVKRKEIAEKMFLGEGTVRNMVSSILTKLDLRDRTQLACFYYQKMV